MITVDVCWWGDDGGSKRIIGVEMAALPRRGDELNLEGLDDEDLAWGFDGDEEPHDVNSLIVQRIVHRTEPEVFDSLVHGKRCSLTEVWTQAPGDVACGHCGRIM